MEDSPLLPVKNTHALVGYYISLIGFIPFIGFPASITAIVLGIQGLTFEKSTHVPGAKAHAMTAVIIGSILGAIHLVTIMLILGILIADA